MPRFWISVSLVAVFCGCASTGGHLERTGIDRPDDFPGVQVHLMYVLPSDGTDEWLDTNGTIHTSVAAFQKWLADQSGGYQLRIDTSGGRPDVTFVLLKLSDDEIRREGDFVRDRIEAELHAAGFMSPDKIYAVYYGGSSDGHCGGGPPSPAPGSVTALYLKGIPGGGDPPCETNLFATDPDRPGYWEHSMLHEIFHAFGAVEGCAPNHAHDGHTGDDPQDLMYAGDQSWKPSILDPGCNDYFGHGRSDCLDVATTPYLKRVSRTWRRKDCRSAPSGSESP